MVTKDCSLTILPGDGPKDSMQQCSLGVSVPCPAQNIAAPQLLLRSFCLIRVLRLAPGLMSLTHYSTDAPAGSRQPSQTVRRGG